MLRLGHELFKKLVVLVIGSFFSYLTPWVIFFVFQARKFKFYLGFGKHVGQAPTQTNIQPDKRIGKTLINEMMDCFHNPFHRFKTYRPCLRELKYLSNSGAPP